MDDSITVRDLDDEVMRGLRARAAVHGRSVEDEALEILRETLGEADDPTPAAPPQNLAAAIRALVDDIGGVELELPPRGRVAPVETGRLVWRNWTKTHAVVDSMH